MIKVARDELQPGEEYTMGDLWTKIRQYATEGDPPPVWFFIFDYLNKDARVNAREDTSLHTKFTTERRSYKKQYNVSKRVYVASQRSEERPRFEPRYAQGAATSPSRSFNAGAYIGRVWALKKLTDAFELALREVRSRPAPWIPTMEFTNDQAVLGILYYTQRLWEVEYGLLEAPPPKVEEDLSLWRRNMTTFDTPVGLIGLDKRRSFFGIDVIRAEMPQTPPIRNAVFLPNYTTTLRESRTGALLAVYQDEPSVPLSWHFAGFYKPYRSEEAQFSYNWMVSSFLHDDVYRHNSYILSQYTIELISGKERYYGDYLTICGNPLIKRKKNSEL
ncbi:hypothetical protein AGDE_15417 [Angomonas deanei]|uniref:Uncharacterized protein n=1 Tax=Angomonas deanei TaxID=59799 RepID=A0A7G2CQX4_9TRYP|nr:hypothetical protein AGDE_15417 [Angomonas deanei]CAD2221885.1 hypothetical protein, conserved [Angomonas deanei]|eukprot:EPY19124.1 hypothetical protein AGDE_15417 [Angomonas deanei]